MEELCAMDKQELFYGLQYLQDNGTSVCVSVCVCVGGGYRREGEEEKGNWM